MTQKQLDMFYQYANAIRKDKTTLLDYYKTVSKAKHNSYVAIKAEKYRNNGLYLAVCSANTFNYSCAYIIYKNDKIWLIYHTSRNIYKFVVDFENFALFPDEYRKNIEKLTNKKFTI